MTESEIIELFNFGQDSALTILQWWVSVTLGVLVVSYLAAKKLGPYSVAAVVVLYIAFSVNFWLALVDNARLMVGYQEELQSLKESGQALSIPAEMLIEGQGSIIQTIAGSVAIFGTFIATILYLIHSFRKGRRPE